MEKGKETQNLPETHLPSSKALRIETELVWLSCFGAEPNGGVTRLLYTPAWVEAQQALAQRMRANGFRVYYDEVGNLFGRLEGSDEPNYTIMTGSHIDTVKCGGKYDGAYGVMASLLAVESLQQRYGQPKRSLEIVSLCEEEGSRFPMTYWGSGSITGFRQYEQIVNLQDAEGISFVDAMTTAGFPDAHLPREQRQDIKAYIELHVEQGAILENNHIAIGIVEHIVGQRRYTMELTGEANHAGTTPMVWRRDALEGASRMIVRLYELARQYGDGLVATVGKLAVEPNIPNVIPGKVSFTVDVRHASEEVLHSFCNQMIMNFQDMAQEQELSFQHTSWMSVSPTPLHTELNHSIEQLCVRDGISHMRMNSGAGHDAQVFQPICPTALIFVPSHKGISHSPQEYTSSEHLAVGVHVLSEILYTLGYEGGAYEKV